MVSSWNEIWEGTDVGGAHTGGEGEARIMCTVSPPQFMLRSPPPSLPGLPYFAEVLCVAQCRSAETSLHGTSPNLSPGLLRALESPKNLRGKSGPISMTLDYQMDFVSIFADNEAI